MATLEIDFDPPPAKRRFVEPDIIVGRGCRSPVNADVVDEQCDVH